jgi:ABC-type multidrug transport system ATPase subunit
MKVSFEKVIIPKISQDGHERELDLTLESSIIFLLPPSQGKTLLFEHIIGLKKDIDGDILINDIPVDLDLEGRFFLERKKIGIIFENPVLLSNLDVKDNLQLILKNSIKELTPAQMDTIVHKTLDDYSLGHTINLRPSELTQNQLRIISFIMGTIHEPELLIWDEPTTNFPEKVNQQFKKELKALTDRKGLFIGLTSSERVADNFNLEKRAL